MRLANQSNEKPDFELRVARNESKTSFQGRLCLWGQTLGLPRPLLPTLTRQAADSSRVSVAPLGLDVSADPIPGAHAPGY